MPSGPALADQRIIGAQDGGLATMIGKHGGAPARPILVDNSQIGRLGDLARHLPPDAVGSLTVACQFEG
jgi:hypothetical protein